MGKSITTLAKWKTSGCWQRTLAYDYYFQKYFNLFMGAYEFKGITYEQQHYILKKLFFDGKISAFIVEGTKLPEGVAPETTNEYPNGMIAFVPFAPCLFDITDFPIKVNLIRVRGATFIPVSQQVVNKDVVLCYIQRNKKSISSVVDFFIQKIVDVEMTIKNNLRALKTPFFIATTPENESKMKALWDKIDSDEGVLYLSNTEIDAIKVLATGTQFNVDKLFAYRQAIENELLTYLGIDNLGIMEKKEHMITDEVNSNNDLINDHSENFISVLEDWCKRIKDVLGYEMSVVAKSSPVVAEKESKESEDEEDENE